MTIPKRTAPKRKRRNRGKSSSQIQKELKVIYSEKNGKLPDLTHLERVRRSKTTGFLVRIILILLVISAAAWTGFFFFTQGIFQGEETLLTTIDGPLEVMAGEEVSYKIGYENTGKVPVASLEMKLSLPIGFEVLSTAPDPTSDLTWTIGSVNPGSDGIIHVNGVFRSEVPSAERIQSLFTYKPANFNSEFQSIQTAKIDIKESILQIDVTGPEKALAGDDISYVINVQNSGSVGSNNLEVRASVPEGFVVTSFEPEASEEGEARWFVQKLESGDLSAITLHGHYTSTATADRTLSAEVGFLNDGIFLPQAKNDQLTDVLGGSLVFHLIANGLNSNQTTELGKDIRISIDYENNGNETIKDLSFVLEAQTPEGLGTPIDWSEADLASGKRSEAILRWGSDEIEALGELEPKDTGIIDLLIPLRDTLGSDRSDQFILVLTANLGQVGNIDTPRSIEASPVTIKINSNASFMTEARFYSADGSPLGSGSMPPTIEETTTYQVSWNLSNSLHSLENVIVSTNLPPDVVFTENSETSAGTLSYNPTTRQVRWNIENLTKNITSASATFDVTITPQEHDLGTFVKLTNATSFDAVDTVTHDTISQAKDILTTELPNDEFAKGQGVVRE